MELNIPYENIPYDMCRVLRGETKMSDFLNTLKKDYRYTDSQIEDMIDILNYTVLKGIKYYPVAKDMERLVYSEDKGLPKDEQIIACIQLREGKYSVWMHQSSRSNEPKLFDMTEYHKALEYFYDMITEERYMHFFAKGVMV